MTRGRTRSYKNLGGSPPDPTKYKGGVWIRDTSTTPPKLWHTLPDGSAVFEVVTA